MLCIHTHTPCRANKSAFAHCSTEWQADSLSYVTSRRIVLCSLLFLAVTAEWEDWRRVWFSKKCLVCNCWGTLKILEFVKAKRLFFSTAFLLLTLYKALYLLLLFYSSHGPRSVKPMPFTTTTITTSTTPMSLATRQPHSSGQQPVQTSQKKNKKHWTYLTLFTTASTSTLQPPLPPLLVLYCIQTQGLGNRSFTSTWMQTTMQT